MPHSDQIDTTNRTCDPQSGDPAGAGASPGTLDPKATHDAELAKQARVLADAPASTGRWWLAVLIGSIVSLPLGWVLAQGVWLPFYIGLFFFAVFGLIVGAATFRAAGGKRQYSTVLVLAGTTVLVLVCWGSSFVFEYRAFPEEMANEVLSRPVDRGGRTAQEFGQALQKNVRAYVQKQYEPGGITGYVRWMLAGGRISKGSLPDVKRTLRRGQQGGIGWAIRIVLSIMLLSFGVATQTFGLRRRWTSTGDTGPVCA